MKVEWELKSKKHPEETMLMLKDAKACVVVCRCASLFVARVTVSWG